MPNSKIKVVFMGTPEFACPSLLSLLNNDRFEILTVITQPDRKVGRNQEIIFSPIKKLALEHGLAVLQPETLKNNTEIINLLDGLKPDFIVVVAYGQILDDKILNIPRYDCINIHGSLLPKYRGASPVEQSILNDDKETGITIMQMDQKMDHGDIYMLQKLKIEEEDTGLTLREKLSKLGADHLPHVLIDIVDNHLKPLPQDHSKASYCKKINKEDGNLNFTEQTARQIIQMIKAFTPWPGCFFQVKNKKIKLIKAKIATSEDQTLNQQKRTKNLKANEYQVEKNKLLIGTLQGEIIPVEVQLEGKKAMLIEEFLKGNNQLFL